MHQITQRANKIPSFIVMDVLERAHALEREGRQIIHLEVGEPDFPTPACICEAAIEAIRKERTHYTHSLGLIELREAICEHYLEKYGVHINPDQIIVTSGTSPAIFMLFSTLLEHGDEIILSNPHYPCYPNFASFLGALMYFATLTEVPVVKAFMDLGMGKGPALALLLAGPALSLPAMLVLSKIMGVKKTLTYVGLVVIMATITGYIFGLLT